MVKRVLRKIISLISAFRKWVNLDENFYLVYTMGKVGSTTIYSSLKRIKPYSEVHQVHFLSDHWIKDILPGLKEHFHKNIQNGLQILDRIKNNPKKKLKIITLTREPVMIAISDLFENWESQYDDIEKVSDAELIRHIEEVDHDYSLTWFDSEFFNYLNVDLYKLPFDRNKGYEIYRYDNFDILCIKLESLNQVSAKAFEEFLGFGLNLENTNSSSTKKGKDQYARLKKNIQIDRKTLENLYESKYVQHFYSQDEVEGFMNKWSS